MNLGEMRSRVRCDLRDEDAQNYRWSDATLDRHITRAVRELSLEIPLRVKVTMVTTQGSRELSLAGVAGLVEVDAVEYPAGQHPPQYVRFSRWDQALTLLVESAPHGGEQVYLYCSILHTLDTNASTLPPQFEDTVAAGAAGYAAVEWACYAIDTVTAGGELVCEHYLAWGRDRLASFRHDLARYSRKNAVGRRTLYIPA